MSARPRLTAQTKLTAALLALLWVCLVAWTAPAHVLGLGGATEFTTWQERP